MERVRKSLGAPPNRKFSDGSDFYTLPVIKDQSNKDEVIGDSFEIALYLDKTYPDTPVLCPQSTIGLHRAFNLQVDTIFTDYVLLFAHGLPFNPATAEQTKQAFVRRAGVSCWEDLNWTGEERTQKLEAFQKALEGLAKVYNHTTGPFLEGEHPIYADLIVGGWLQQYKAALKEWDQMLTWHDGLWKRLHEALQVYAQVL